MKKVIFTAIAMIAFSGASMANTKEVKKKVAKEEVMTKCMSAAIAYYEAVMGCCNDDIAFYNSVVSRCK
jgi:hypothetical protein